MPRLDELQQACDGWIWWLDYPGDGGEQYVGGSRWERLVAAHHARPGAPNETLNAEVQ